MEDEDDSGYYSLQQLASQEETERKKARVGILPVSARTLRRMWGRGDFPKPMVWMGKNVWRKRVVNEYVRLTGQGMAATEAATRAEATVG